MSKKLSLIAAAIIALALPVMAQGDANQGAAPAPAAAPAAMPGADAGAATAPKAKKMHKKGHKKAAGAKMTHKKGHKKAAKKMKMEAPKDAAPAAQTPAPVTP